MINSHAVPCPHCRAPNNAHMHPDGSYPSDGSYALCVHCGGFGVYVTSPFGLIVRPATDEEVAVIMSTPEAAEIAALARSYSDPLDVARHRTISNIKDL